MKIRPEQIGFTEIDILQFGSRKIGACAFCLPQDLALQRSVLQVLQGDVSPFPALVAEPQAVLFDRVENFLRAHTREPPVIKRGWIPPFQRFAVNFPFRAV
jgi:hypothetical protein